MDIKELKKINDYLWEIPSSYRADMRVPARIFATEEMLKEIFNDRSVTQLINVATLPGILGHAIAMPDIHEGYGFPIGGVAALDSVDGVISPGGIGYDINCGVRLLRSSVTYDAIKPYLAEVANAIYRDVPSGVGRSGKFKFKEADLDNIFLRGAKEMVVRGYGTTEDLLYTEEGGAMDGADPSAVSMHAKSRGRDQLGTLGSGNHFLEIGRVDEIFDHNAARVFGLSLNQITIAIHCGSRGLGHQIATDYIRIMLPKLASYKILLPDRELACAPCSSHEGKRYFGAMIAAANFAFANRHMIMHTVREGWKRTLGNTPLATHDLDLSLVYDVAHNIGKKETHMIKGKERNVIMHRKGATRAFTRGAKDIPEAYKNIGHPVLIPGTMGTASYILVGTETGMTLAFGSSCHGAGRRMSRAQAKREIKGTDLRQQLESEGILIRCASNSGLVEEAPQAYKDVDAVVGVVHGADIARKVVKLKPVAVIKGD